MKKIKAFKIIDHGYCPAQYFQGQGTAFTIYDDVYTGAGNDAKEAYNEAVEQLVSVYDVGRLPKRPRGINAKNKVPFRLANIEDGEYWYYVSILVA